MSDGCGQESRSSGAYTGRPGLGRLQTGRPGLEGAAMDSSRPTGCGQGGREDGAVSILTSAGGQNLQFPRACMAGWASLRASQAAFREPA